jgi:hypothetical protein
VPSALLKLKKMDICLCLDPADYYQRNLRIFYLINAVIISHIHKGFNITNKYPFVFPKTILLLKNNGFSLKMRIKALKSIIAINTIEGVVKIKKKILFLVKVGSSEDV